MRKMLLMCAVVLATLCVAAGETWVKCTTGECDYFVTIDGVRWSVLQNGTAYKLGTNILDWPIVPVATSGDVVVPSALRESAVTVIPASAFCGCDKITSIDIPATITLISGRDTFVACTAITNYTVAANNSNYCSQDGLLLSKDKTQLVSYPRAKEGEFILPSSVTHIAGDAVSVSRFVSVWIPDGVVSIGYNAFIGSGQLRSVRFPKSLSTIGSFSFGMCDLTSVDFEGAPPEGVAEAGINTDSAVRYNVAYEAEWLPVIEQCGWTNAKPYMPKPYPEGGPYKEMVEGIEWTFTVTNGEASVGTGSSSGTAIPAATTGEIAIPTELGGRIVTSIGQEAFYCCKAITGATIPSSITSIGKSAFGKCIKLEGVMIPASVTNIGICAFSGDCESLKWIDVEAESAYYSAQDGVLFNKDKTALIQYPGAKAGTYTIPESVTHVGAWSFQWCHNLERLTVPTNVVSMAESAFFTGVYTFAIDFEGAPPKGIRDAFINSASPIRYNIAYRDEWEQVAKDCQWSNAKPYEPFPKPEGGPYKETVEGVEWTFFVTNGEACVGTGTAYSAVPTTTQGAITVPSELGGHPVTGVGNRAFSSCTELTGVTIPEGVASLGHTLLYLNSKITELTIPASVTNIAEGAFYACFALQAIRVADGNQHYMSPDDVLYTKDGTSLVCCPAAKKSVSVLTSVTNICTEAFGECRELESITLPPKLATLGNLVFYGCIKVTELTFPSSVIKVGVNMFPACPLLSTFYFEGLPPEGVERAGFKTGATIKYSGQYFNAWERVIEQCGWTNTTPYNPSGEPYPDGGLYAEMADGVRWLFMVRNGEASVGVSSSMYGRSAIPHETIGDIVVPGSLGGRNVTDVSGAAFYWCTNLTSVTISTIVTNVAAGAFEGCSSLQSIEVAPDNMHLAALDGVLFDKAMKNLVAFPGGLEGEYTIPSGVTSVYGQAFFSCQGLTKITLPLSVSIVGSWAFGNCTNLNAVDFECAPPKWVEYSDINRDAAIRYNIDYRLEWEPVVKACGWTNAKPYTPRLAEYWRVSYDLAGGDFVTEDQDWHLKSVRTVAGASSNEEFRLKLVVGEAPVREGYDFIGWTNLVHGSELFQPNNTYLLSFASEEEFYPLTALWQAKELPTVSPTTSWDDTIQWYKVLGGQAKEPQGERDVTIANAAFKMSYAPVCQDPTNAMIVLVRIKAPSFIRNAEQASAVQFNVDGEYFEQGATSPIGYSYPRVLFHAKEKGDPREYYYIEWYAYVRPGEMSRALAENEVGHAFGETKLYCNWNGDVTYDAVYAIKFDADSCKLYRDTKMIFPLVQQLVWHKGFDPSETKSDVSRASWDHILAYEYYENTIDLASLEGVNDLVRTGYTQQAWVPEVTRGYAVLMKDLTLVTNVVEVTAQWSTNSYDAVLVLGKPGVTIDEEYEIPEDWTVEELPFALPTPEQVISERQVWGLGYWTNQFGKAVIQIDLESVGTNEVDEIPFGAVMTGIVYKVDYIMTNDFANIDKPGTPYQSVNENIMQYSAETNGGNAVFLKDASCFGCKFEGWETKIKTPTGDKWIPASSFSTIRGGDKLFRAKWTEYQAMVVEHDTNTTNYFAVVADAIKAVTNSNTTIAFLDAKGDGVQDPVQIKIPAELKNIAVNFCMLSYTNATGEAALDIGDNAEVRVENLPGFIGLEGYSMSRLVQTNGTYAVRVGEGATFTLDDKNIVLDVDDREYVKALKEFADRNYQYYYAKAKISYRNNTLSASTYQDETVGLVAFTNYIAKAGGEWNRQIIWSDEFSSTPPYEGVNYEMMPNDPNPIIVEKRAVVDSLRDRIIMALAKASNDWARAQWVYRDAAAIYAPESATLVLRAGNIGSTAAGTSRDAAAICWEGHDQYLASAGLNFATKPHQDRVEGWSQVAAGYIWTTNGVEGAEFPYTVAKIGEVGPIYTDVRPGDRLTTRGSHVKGVFWADGDAVTNGLFTIQNPTGVIPINDTVVDTVPVEGEPILVHEVGTGLFSIGYADFTDGFINMLVETMEANAAVRISASYDWDGVAGNDDTGTNAKTYVLSYNAVQEGDIVVSNATEQLFPKVGKITYEQEIPVIETNRLVATYTIYDTIHAPGLVLEPAIGWCTNVQGKTYRFDGWHEDDELVTNFIHEVGVGQDVRDRVLRAVFTKVSWDVLDLEGTVVGKAATVQEAVDMIPDGGTIRFFGKQDEATLNEPIVVSSENYGSIYTIDLNGESFTNAPTFKGEYLFELVGPFLDVTIQNGTIGFEADMPSNDQTGPGGVRASDDAKVTLAKTLTIKTDNTMVCAEDGSLVTLNGAQLANRGKDAGVTAFDEATLVFTNMTYANTAYAANAEIRVYNSLLAPDIKGEIGDTITAIYALDGAEVYLGLNARIANAGDLQTILLRNAKLTVNDPMGNPDSPTISNEKGDAIFTTWGADESCDIAEIDLVRGFILANSSAIQIHAGKLTATNVTAGVGAVRAVTYGSTISIDNDLHILEPEDIRLWNGMYQSLYGDAILSRNTNQGEREYYLKFFLDCAMERTGEGIETITKGALFSYTFRTQYLASGYRVCTDDECIEESGNFWYFIKTIPYAISYELDGGEWKSGASQPPTVYDVEMSGNGYMDLNLTQYVPDREGFYFGGWTNAAGQQVTIVPVGTTGDLSFYATWEVLQPIVPGEKIVVPEGKAEAKAAEINGNPAVKALYLKAPGGIETTEEYRECFNAVATSGSTVEFALSEKGTNEVAKATTTIKTSVLEVVFSEGTTLTIDEPLVGFYYSLRQGGDLSVGAKADLNKLGGRDEISFELTKGPFQYFYQTLVTPTPQK